MPQSTHPSFKQPENDSIAVWRYMDFTKFVAMLERRALFLSRADLLGDPFEGSYSLENERLRPQFMQNAGMSPGDAALIANAYRLAPQLMFVNCWHMNNGESAAMWKCYTTTSESVAIQSRYSTLRDLLGSGTFIGTVEYIDYTNAIIPEGNTFTPFLYKRLSFKHEHEARVVRPHIEFEENSNRGAEEQLPGIWETVDLSVLIERVYIAPTAPAWFRDLVEAVSRKYGYTFTVDRSDLEATPFF